MRNAQVDKFEASRLTCIECEDRDDARNHKPKRARGLSQTDVRAPLPQPPNIADGGDPVQEARPVGSSNVSDETSTTQGQQSTHVLHAFAQLQVHMQSATITRMHARTHAHGARAHFHGALSRARTRSNVHTHAGTHARTHSTLRLHNTARMRIHARTLAQCFEVLPPSGGRPPLPRR